MTLALGLGGKRATCEQLNLVYHWLWCSSLVARTVASYNWRITYQVMRRYVFAKETKLTV